MEEKIFHKRVRKGVWDDLWGLSSFNLRRQKTLGGEIRVIKEFCVKLRPGRRNLLSPDVLRLAFAGRLLFQDALLC